jgi:hypothetical protein
LNEGNLNRVESGLSIVFIRSLLQPTPSCALLSAEVKPDDDWIVTMARISLAVTYCGMGAHWFEAPGHRASSVSENDLDFVALHA